MEVLLLLSKKRNWFYPIMPFSSFSAIACPFFVLFYDEMIAIPDFFASFVVNDIVKFVLDINGFWGFVFMLVFLGIACVVGLLLIIMVFFTLPYLSMLILDDMDEGNTEERKRAYIKMPCIILFLILEIIFFIMTITIDFSWEAKEGFAFAVFALTFLSMYVVWATVSTINIFRANHR